jgi:hypothetical protein
MGKMVGRHKKMAGKWRKRIWREKGERERLANGKKLTQRKGRRENGVRMANKEKLRDKSPNKRKSGTSFQKIKWWEAHRKGRESGERENGGRVVKEKMAGEW